MGCNSIADVLRRMDDEDLACFIICPIVDDAPCEKPPEECFECCLKWLHRPAWALNKWKKEIRKRNNNIAKVFDYREKMEEYQ